MAQVVGQPLLRRALAPVMRFQRGGDGEYELRRRRDAGEGDDAGAAGKKGLQLRGNGQGQPRLADAGRAQQGEQAPGGVGEAGNGGVDLAASAQQRCERCRQQGFSFHPFVGDGGLHLHRALHLDLEGRPLAACLRRQCEQALQQARFVGQAQRRRKLVAHHRQVGQALILFEQ